MEMSYNIFIASKSSQVNYEKILPGYIQNYSECEYEVATTPDGEFAGMLVFTILPDKVELLFFYVVPEHRGKRLCCQLIYELLQILEASFIYQPIEIVWSESEREVMEAILRHFPSFTIGRDESYCTITPQMRNSSRLLQKLKEKKWVAHPLFLDSKVKSTDELKRLIPEKYSQYILNIDSYEKELCFYSASSKEKIDALILFEKYDEHTLILSFMYGKKHNEIAFAAVLDHALSVIEQSYADYTIEMTCTNDRAKNLAKKVFLEGYQPTSIYSAIRFGQF